MVLPVLPEFMDSLLLCGAPTFRMIQFQFFMSIILLNIFDSFSYHLNPRLPSHPRCQNYTVDEVVESMAIPTCRTRPTTEVRKRIYFLL